MCAKEAQSHFLEGGDGIDIEIRSNQKSCAQVLVSIQLLNVYSSYTKYGQLLSYLASAVSLDGSAAVSVAVSVSVFVASVTAVAASATSAASAASGSSS